MASDLANILATGQNAALMDPMMAAVGPQLQLSQMMAQQGLSTAPAYPMQAAARLAQALAGVKIGNDVQNTLAEQSGNAVSEMSKIFRPGTPIGDGLISSSPLVRMLAMQQAGKEMLLNSEIKTQKPGDTLVAPATARVGGGVVGAGSPAQAAAVEAAKNPALIARAGGEAAAKARYEPGGDRVIQTPQGPQTIPMTAADRAAQSAAIPIVPKPVATVPAPPRPAVAETGLASGVAKVPDRVPPLPATAPMAGAQADQPTSVADRLAAAGIMGKPLPNPAIDPAVAADTKEVAADREKAIAGQQDMATIRTIQDFLPKVATGWSADTKLEGARVLKELGISDDKIADWLKTDVASGQILQKKFLELSAAAARTMGAREPGSVIQMFAKAYPNIETDPQAITLQTNALYMDRMRSQQLAQEKTNYLNDSINGVQATGQYRGLKGFNEQFNQNHPAERYLSAAESMSKSVVPWQRIKDPTQQQAIINLIPSGTHFMAPNGKLLVKP